MMNQIISVEVGEHFGLPDMRVLGVARFAIVPSFLVNLVHFPSRHIFMAIDTAGFHLVGIVGELLGHSVDFLCVFDDHSGTT